MNATRFLQIGWLMSGLCAAAQAESLGPAGLSARYECEREGTLPGSVVRTFTLALGAVEPSSSGEGQWLSLAAIKSDGERFQVWLLTKAHPVGAGPQAEAAIARYVVRRGEEAPQEFVNAETGASVLPTVVDWTGLLPGPLPTNGGMNFPEQLEYLGQSYRRQTLETVQGGLALPAKPDRFLLHPDLLVGMAGNTRQKDETRRYDGSDYDLVRLSREDYREMAEAGITCVKVDPEQRRWVDDLGLFYWGVGGKDIAFPETLYDSRYLGPALFLDEPAVETRDYDLRPKLAKDAAFRESMTPQVAWVAFTNHFQQTLHNGPSTSLAQGLAARTDLNLGSLRLVQANLFSWDTLVSTAAYQLSQDPQVPIAMVFEPPGRVGMERTLPELDMTYGCQIPTGDPNNFIDIIYGFLRGAARLSRKDWGTSIYGAVDRTDASAFLNRAYDLGATRFFFWDSAQLACVPYHECLALARQIRMRASDHPGRDLAILRQAGEVAIVLPLGYNLGHVHLGKGSLWGLPELNLERVNPEGVKYRQVMSNFFIEIERCLRLGVAFDLLPDLPGLNLSGYREVVRVHENGQVEAQQHRQIARYAHARAPSRPEGIPPGLTLHVNRDGGSAPLEIEAQATVVENTAPVYYTLGADRTGVYHNARVAWELYGPGPEDYEALPAPGLKPEVSMTPAGARVSARFVLKRAGTYRLRAATVDVAGRSTVRWLTINVTK